MADPVAHSLEFSDPPAIEASCSPSLLFNANGKNGAVSWSWPFKSRNGNQRNGHR